MVILRWIVCQKTPIIIVKPGMDRILVKDGILYAQFELVAQERASSACVNNHTYIHAYISVTHCKVNLWSSWLREISTLYADTLVNSGSKLVSMLQEHQVKLASVHVKGIVAINTGLFPLLIFDAYMAIGFQTFKAISIDRAFPIRRPGRPIFSGEPRLIHLLKETNLFKDPSRSGHERFSYMRSWEQITFKHDARETGFCHVGCRTRSCRAATNNTNIKVEMGHVYLLRIFPGFCADRV